MNTNIKLASAALAGLLTTGLLAATPAFASEGEKGSCKGKGGCGGKAISEKSECKGKGGCSGKDEKAGCEGKDKAADEKASCAGKEETK